MNEMVIDFTATTPF